MNRIYGVFITSLVLFTIMPAGHAVNYFSWGCDSQTTSLGSCMSLSSAAIDSSVKHSGTASMRLDIPPDTGGGNQGHVGCEVPSSPILGSGSDGGWLYYRWYMKMDPGFRWGFGTQKMKSNRVMLQSQTPPIPYTMYMGRDAVWVGECPLCQQQGSALKDDPSAAIIGYDFNPATNDAVRNWQEYVIGLKKQSCTSCYDGEYHLWVNGQEIDSVKNMRFCDGTNCADWVEAWGANMVIPYPQFNDGTAGGKIWLDDFSLDSTRNSMYSASMDPYPNEPAGYTKITERTFSSTSEGSWSENSGYTIVSDTTAPQSVPYVAQDYYPAGFEAGTSPGYAETYIDSANANRIYVSFWLKLSSNWYGHPSQVNKIGYAWISDTPVVIFDNSGVGTGDLVPIIHLQDLPYGDGERYLRPNLISPSYQRGQWHHWETVMILNTGSNADGEAHWWIDGVKVGQYTDVEYGSSSLSKIWSIVSWRPIWGGMGGTVPAGQYMWMDHYYVSGLGSSLDTTAPTQVAGLSATASSSTASLSWSAATDNVGVAGYIIYRCQGTSCTPSQTATSTSTSYSDSGLTASTAYRYQLSAYDAAGNEGTKSSIVSITTGSASAGSECSSYKDGWIWCDDFEQDRFSSYFEYDNNGGDFVRTAGVGRDGSTGMRVRFQVGEVGAGGLKLAFGKTPSSYFKAVDAGTSNFRDIYWRMYLKNQAGWTGHGGDKLSRAIVFASSNWAEAAIGHVWSGTDSDYLVLDPASGTDTSGSLKTTQYNDFDNLRWLGAIQANQPLFDSAHTGAYHCIEAHMKLNDAGQSNGIFELWMDDTLQAQKTGMDWLGSYNTYGINSVLFENYWNAGSPVQQERYFDNIVVSTQRIGCGSTTTCHAADTDCSGCISLIELNAHITKWLTGQVTIASLMDAIRIWKVGC
jgi:chitodextrinase